MLKFYAPYRKFRAKVNGFDLFFPEGVRIVEDSNKKEIEAIKSIPPFVGIIKDQFGNIVNQIEEKAKTDNKPKQKAKATKTVKK